MNTTEKSHGPEPLSPKDFAALGLNSIAFVKPVVVNDEVGFAIHAADGSPIAVFPDLDVAHAAIRQHDMEPLSVH